jgi:hypothetical protein
VKSTAYGKTWSNTSLAKLRCCPLFDIFNVLKDICVYPKDIRATVFYLVSTRSLIVAVRISFSFYLSSNIAVQLPCSARGKSFTKLAASSCEIGGRVLDVRLLEDSELFDVAMALFWLFFRKSSKLALKPSKRGSTGTQARKIAFASFAAKIDESKHEI